MGKWTWHTSYNWWLKLKEFNVDVPIKQPSEIGLLNSETMMDTLPLRLN